MKLRNLAIGIALCGAVLMTGRVLSQEEHEETGKDKGDKTQGKAMPEDMAKMMEEWMKQNAPSDGHKQLEHFVGNWEMTTRTMAPGMPPKEYKGTSTIKWMLGGRFLQEEHTGTFMDMPYEGLGLTGYDNFRKTYNMTWASNIGTAILYGSGARNPQTGTFTYFAEMDEPGLVIGRMVKMVYRVKSDDEHVFEMYDLHAGDDYKVFEITYKRKGS